MRLVKHLLCGVFFFFQSSAWGALTIPANLSDGDQELLLQYVGFATAFRPVDNPYPLGLYSGLEIGLAIEDMPTGDIGYLGSGASVEKSIYYPRLTVGKGIFDNVDLFFSFTPYSQSTGLGIYSGGMRWGFFQATFVPASFSLLISGSSTNLNNLFIAETVGVDLITGVNADPFSFYIGAGTLYGQGQYDGSITIETTQTNQVGRSFHTLLGAAFNVSKAFLAFELDNYNTTTLSFKLGAKL